MKKLRLGGLPIGWKNFCALFSFSVPFPPRCLKISHLFIASLGMILLFWRGLGIVWKETIGILGGNWIEGNCGTKDVFMWKIAWR